MRQNKCVGLYKQLQLEIQVTWAPLVGHTIALRSRVLETALKKGQRCNVPNAALAYVSLTPVSHLLCKLALRVCSRTYLKKQYHTNTLKPRIKNGFIYLIMTSHEPEDLMEKWDKNSSDTTTTPQKKKQPRSKPGMRFCGLMNPKPNKLALVKNKIKKASCLAKAQHGSSCWQHHGHGRGGLMFSSAQTGKLVRVGAGYRAILEEKTCSSLQGTSHWGRVSNFNRAMSPNRIKQQEH